AGCSKSARISRRFPEDCEDFAACTFPVRAQSSGNRGFGAVGPKARVGCATASKGAPRRQGEPPTANLASLLRARFFFWFFVEDRTAEGNDTGRVELDLP